MRGRPTWIDPNHAVASYVGIVSNAIGQTNLSRTTLLALHGVVDGRCHRILHRGRSWCPACMHEASKHGSVYYDRLIWQLLAIERCPIHKIELESTCPACGIEQRFFNSTSGMLVCWKCGHTLLSSPATWRVRVNPTFGEKDCCGLVQAISDGRLVEGEPSAFRKFSDELVALIEPLIYGRHIRHPGSGKRTFDVRSWKARATPAFETILKRCHAVGVSVFQVIENPIEADHQACCLELDRYEIPTHRKPRRAADLVKLAEDRMANLLATPENNLALPSLAAIARELQVSTGYIRYRLPTLVPLYCDRVRLQNLHRHRRSASLAARWLRSAAMADVFSTLGSSQRRLAKHVSMAFGMSIHASRAAVRSAFSDRVRSERAEKKTQPYRKRNYKNPRVTVLRTSILRTLILAGGKLTSREIEVALDSKASRVYQALASMEKAGWIRRYTIRMQPTKVELTDSGWSVLNPRVVAREVQTKEQLSPRSESS